MSERNHLSHSAIDSSNPSSASAQQQVKDDIHYYKPMLPTRATNFATGPDWFYEVKYDGFRTLVYAFNDCNVMLISRNLKPLNDQFPEVIEYIQTLSTLLQNETPFILDAELCVLQNDNKANFALIQQRGRSRSAATIQKLSKNHPAHLLCFDLLHWQGIDLKKQPYTERKQHLQSLFDQYALPSQIDVKDDRPLQMVPASSDAELVWKAVEAVNGEGIVCKQGKSVWLPGKRTTNWLKIKNMNIVTCFILGYDETNGYFHIGLMKDDGGVAPIGLFSHGLEGNEREALIQIVKNNQTHKTKQLITIVPSICVDIEYLDIYEGQLREPRFHCFRLDVHWEDCSWEQLNSNERL